MKKSLKNIAALVAISAFCAIPVVSHAAVSLSAVSSEVSHHPSQAGAIAAAAIRQSPGNGAEIAAAALNGLGSHATPKLVAEVLRAVLPLLPPSDAPELVLVGLQILSENGVLDDGSVRLVVNTANTAVPDESGAIASAVSSAYPQYADAANGGHGGGTSDDSGNVNTSGPILPASFLSGGGGTGVSGTQVTPVTNG